MDTSLHFQIRYLQAQRRYWTKLPGFPARQNPCLTCPPIPATAPLTMRIAVGFGDAYAAKGDLVVYREPIEPDTTWENCCPLSAIEAAARTDPDHDWRVHLHGPLHGEVYQRQGEDLWVLVQRDNGFA